jgi:hypothetical protein
MNKTGVIITLIGIGLFFISIFASEGYSSRDSIMWNMYNMKVVIIDTQRLIYDKPPTPTPEAEDPIQKEKRRRLRELKGFGWLGDEPGLGSGLGPSPRVVGRRVSMPLSFLLSLSTILILIGIGKIILSKKQK